MTTRAFRITVRGVFAALSEQQRTALLADAAQHDILTASYTAEGHLSYDIASRPAFTFRFLETGEEEQDLAPAAERAEAAARAWLDERGYGYKELRSQAEDLSQAPMGKRQRREARKTQTQAQ